MFALLALLLAPSPASLAPGAEELAIAEARFSEIEAAALATAAATTQLQAVWAHLPEPKQPCDDHARLSLAWRIERFGAAWREAAQALTVQAAALHALREAPTVAPLVRSGAAKPIAERLERAADMRQRFLQASVWEATYVRPTLAACPLTGPGLDNGVTNPPVLARGDLTSPTAVLAIGDGYACPGALRADDAILLVGAEACWAPDATCSCTPAPVFPGAVLGPPVVDAGDTPPPT